MEWATGIGTEGGRLVAKIATEDSELTTRQLCSLAAQGMPTMSRPQRKNGLTTDFASWKIVPPSSYAAAFGLPSKMLQQSEHLIYEFQVRETKVQVPALVLMRALFYPAKYILETMFRPQALDAIGFFADEAVHVDSTLTKGSYGWANQMVRSSLRWMFAFPTANKMAHSVHEYAMRGRIGLELPDATVRVTVAGKKIGDTYYATELTISRLFALEQTFDHFPKLPLLVHESAGTQAKPADLTVPVGVHGVELSNDEWREVEPVLLSRTRHRPRLSQRDLFDSILKKLYTGTPWRKITYKTGTFIHASQAYRVWKQCGTFAEALDLLRELRQAS